MSDLDKSWQRRGLVCAQKRSCATRRYYFYSIFKYLDSENNFEACQTVLTDFREDK